MYLACITQIYSSKLPSMANLLERINVSRTVCNHLVGTQHTRTHRKIVGIVIMCTGIGIAHLAILIHIEIVHFLGETLGAAVHGVGLIPFISTIDKG